MKKVLVTGAAGFVGSNITNLLLNSGISVRALVRTEEQARRVSALGCEAVLGDLTDIGSLERAVTGVSGVYHIAALFRQAGVPESQYTAVNVDGTKHLLDASIKAGVKRFIHCSTVGVHGHITFPPASEESPFSPGDPYQRSKLSGETLVNEYFSQGKITGAVIRPAMIYGPNDERTLKLFKMLASRRFFYVGPGNALVHFIDVRDLANAFKLVMEREDINRQTYIIAGESYLSLNSLVSIICSIMGVPPPWLHLPVRPVQMLGSLCEAICEPFNINPPLYRRRVDFFTKDRSFDCSKAVKELGFQPKLSLVQELLDIINSYIENGDIDSKGVAFPSLMLRNLDGKINLWNNRAVDTYGWSKEQALGNISHSFLKTTFPDNLEKINDNLSTSGRWHGVLGHNTNNGSRISVDSKWFLIKRLFSPDPYVLELNNIKAGQDRNGSLREKGTSMRSALLSTNIPSFLEELSMLSAAI